VPVSFLIELCSGFIDLLHDLQGGSLSQLRTLCSMRLSISASQPVCVSGNSAQLGQVIDRQGYNELTYLVLVGDLRIPDAGATFAALLEESDNSGMASATMRHMPT